MLTRREVIKLFGLGTAGLSTAPRILSCGDELTRNTYDDCEDAENGISSFGDDTFVDIEINAPDRIQSEIAAHLHFLQDFSGEEVVNLINRITVYDPYQETCVRHEELAALGGFTNGEGDIYLRSEIVTRNKHYWPSTFTLPYTLAFFASYGGQANILSHEVWHTISRKLGDLGEICQKYTDNRYEWSIHTTSDCQDLDERIANDYARYGMAAYLLQLNLPSSPVFEQFLLPSLRAGEVSKEEITTVITGEDQVIPVTNSKEAHERCLSLFIDRGFIRSPFAETLSYNNILQGFHEMYSRWREHADEVLRQT